MVKEILSKLKLTNNSFLTDKELEEYLRKVAANIPITYHFNEDRTMVLYYPYRSY